MTRRVRTLAALSIAAHAACAAENRNESGDGTADGGLASISVSAGSEDGTNEGTAGPPGDDASAKLDLASNSSQTSDSGGNPGDCPGSSGGGRGDVEFSTIWIANSPEGTVSKIDTRTAQELGRYYTGPSMGADDPSRTSVNLRADVAVANRAGGIVKIAARVESCVDKNGNGNIDTSTAATDVLAWGEDECVLWYREILVSADPPVFEYPNCFAAAGCPHFQGPRPTAWDQGEAGDPCLPDTARVWTGWFDKATNVGKFWRLSGLDGTTLDEVNIPDFEPGGQTFPHGPYGGAVDGDGAFWVTGLEGPLYRIDGDTLAVERWDNPEGTMPYGIALDANGNPWLAGLDGNVLRFDATTKTWDTPITVGSGGGGAFGDGNLLRGLQIDRNGHAWIASSQPCVLVQLDTASKTLIRADIPLPGCAEAVGVSIDVDGFVWLPDKSANQAYKVDPMTYDVTTVTGLRGPYTYSDMTGAGLDLVTNPPS